MKLSSFLYILLDLALFSDGARILGIFPSGARSHFIFNEAIMKTLHSVGHNITLISPFSSLNTINFTSIDSSFGNPVQVGLASVHQYSNLHPFSHIQISMKYFKERCHEIMKIKEIEDALNSNEKIYDLMIIQMYVSFECLIPIADKQGIPIIGTVQFRSWKIVDYFMGVNNNPAIIPLETGGQESLDSFFERVYNTWTTFGVYGIYNTLSSFKMKHFYDKYFNGFDLSFKHVQLVFYNNHLTLLPRTLPPNAVEVGGIHIQPVKPLPVIKCSSSDGFKNLDLRKFIDEAEHGAILFSLGSVVKSSTLSSETTLAFLEAFASTPYRVIWKYENVISDLPENVILCPWLPQHDILNHKKVIVFISHCGLSGIFEAISTGTPIISTPLFLDQATNAALIENLNIGIRLDIKTVTKEKILEAINTIIKNRRYNESMQQVSQIFRDRPLSPQQSVIYWTEYVLNYKENSNLKSESVNMPFYKYFLLDVICLIICSCLSILLIRKIIYKACRPTFA